VTGAPFTLVPLVEPLSVMTKPVPDGDSITIGTARIRFEAS
jgi:hypothetical protein